ncbi:uncharacterized protein OGAPODRAFT_17262 [Ogataea polymorpha]|uniref:uncharacterized protein n=1 Tax=Ogataea polymorpha TaxID=460523 RepID=UPI0007F494A6|nr:uncharacterized protein OGAPODRAFT_17262 [Ogataea polymorpha]OBA14516.1 hypothetical protein OGAPODRAFT_17262 [Ogataea polymorpha]
MEHSTSWDLARRRWQGAALPVSALCGNCDQTGMSAKCEPTGLSKLKGFFALDADLGRLIRYQAFHELVLQ